MGINAFTLASWHSDEQRESKAKLGCKFQPPKLQWAVDRATGKPVRVIHRERLESEKPLTTARVKIKDCTPASVELALAISGKASEIIGRDGIKRSRTAHQANLAAKRPKELVRLTPQAPSALTAPSTLPEPRFYMWPSRVPVY